MFDTHTLNTIYDGGPIWCWRLVKEPGSSAGQHERWVEVTVTPAGVHLMGDVIPDSPFGVQAPMALENWVSEMTPEYLAERFLRPVWVPEMAEQHFEQMRKRLREIGRNLQDRDANDIATDLWRLRKNDESIFDSAAAWEKGLHEYLQELTAESGAGPYFDSEEVYPPAQYDPIDVGRLAAIHDRFRTLFRERYRLDDGRVVPR